MVGPYFDTKRLQGFPPLPRKFVKIRASAVKMLDVHTRMIYGWMDGWPRWWGKLPTRPASWLNRRVRSYAFDRNSLSSGTGSCWRIRIVFASLKWFLHPMTPQTPIKVHSRKSSTFSTPGTPATPLSGYVLAQEETPTRGSERGPESETAQEFSLRPHEEPIASSSGSGSGSGSFNGDSMLEVLEDDEGEEREEEEEGRDEAMTFSDGEGDEEEGFDAGEPLVSRSRQRRRRRWEEEEEKNERSLIEVSSLVYDIADR